MNIFLVDALMKRDRARLLQWQVFLSDDNFTLNGPLLQSPAEISAAARFIFAVFEH